MEEYQETFRLSPGFTPNRSFVFDSLSRLTQTNNPETGATNYTYDAVGNLLTKTDARSIVTTFTYDALYRVTQKSYSDGVTPTANFVFDQCPSGGCPTGITPLYPIDRLVKSYTASAQSYYNYDPMGRIATNWQCTPVNCGTSFFNLGYTYDQIGDQTVVSYNGSFTATTTYNGAADPTALTSNLSDSQHPANLASAITYGPTGQPIALSYGNGLAETLSYNNRLQPQQLSTINSTTMANVLSMTLSFVDPVSGHNNGNLMSMSATGAQVISGRSYTYDSLNRLTAMSAPGDSSACTGLSWTYDAWGNRSAQTVTGGSCPDAFTTTFTQNNNRMDSYSYDAAGNLLGDGTHTYTYDAEGRILKVDAGSTATYVYDAEGRRIEKIKGSVQTHYWYGTDDQVRTEWNQSGALQNNYLYLGGKMLAQYTSTTTMFAHLDHLGSTRLMTAVNGSTAECDDFLPFGEQLSYSGTHPCSNTADTAHKYTGQERDTETNLDKFEARYFSSTMGRFMIPDWDAKPVTVPYAHFGNPQSLNLYVYVSNNPLTFADPDGHETADEKPHEAAGAGCGVDMACESKAGPTGAAGSTQGAQYTTVHYDVHGVDAAAAIAAANSSSDSGCAARAGCTTPQFSYTYDPAGTVQGNSASLTATNVTVTVNQTVSLPNWVEYKNASPSEQKAWDTSIANLTAHEEGHVAINRAGANDIQSAIQGTTATGSGISPRQAVTRAQANLQASVKRKFDAALSAIGGRNHAYDVSTNNGRN